MHLETKDLISWICLLKQGCFQYSCTKSVQVLLWDSDFSVVYLSYESLDILDLRMWTCLSFKKDKLVTRCFGKARNKEQFHILEN